jgi:16S rRNA (guanine527-N7)-methyltransferase
MVSRETRHREEKNPMLNDAWIDFFSKEVQSAGLSLTEKQQELFLSYMLELLEWNRSINLTRIVEPRSIAIKHFLDSMLVARYIEPSNKNIADIGSGAGFPGIPLAILAPDCRIVLIESARKKTSFLKNIIRALQLNNVEVFNGRAQAFPHPATFDIAISRAFASLSDFAAIAERLIKPQGSIVCMKGPLPMDEIEALKNQGNRGFELVTHSYCLPRQDGTRSLVLLRRCFT